MNTIPTAIRESIMNRLHQIEADYNVHVLFAIEAGSRAWGFPSPDSDYDVRFIYTHSPDWYLRCDVERDRDVIETPITDDIDLTGWDIRKAMYLLSKTNPGMIEWLQSPIQYIDNPMFRQHCMNYLLKHYPPDQGVLHYRNTARTTWGQHLGRPEVNVKKYFYALRPLLACMWIRKYDGAIPPIEFSVLRTVVTGETGVQEAFDWLLEIKERTNEKGLTPTHPVLDQFIIKWMDHYSGFIPEVSESQRLTMSGDVNMIFRLCILNGDWMRNPLTGFHPPLKHVSAPPPPTPKGTVCH